MIVVLKLSHFVFSRLRHGGTTVAHRWSISDTRPHYLFMRLDYWQSVISKPRDDLFTDISDQIPCISKMKYVNSCNRNIYKGSERIRSTWYIRSHVFGWQLATRWGLTADVRDNYPLVFFKSLTTLWIKYHRELLWTGGPRYVVTVFEHMS